MSQSTTSPISNPSVTHATPRGTPATTPDMRAWVEIDLGALARNYQAIVRHTGRPMLPMIKADGYGLGAVAVARFLASEQPWGFGVATADEGVELRDAGVTQRIIVFIPPLAREFPTLQAHQLIPALGQREAIETWVPSGAPWHLDIDTGMHRSGTPWTAVGTLEHVFRCLPPAGVFTHFHSSDQPDGSVALQTHRFRSALAALPGSCPVLHGENSGALERNETGVAWTFGRPGIFLYGGSTTPHVVAEPVVALRARVVDLRVVPPGDTVSYGATYRATMPRRIATVAAGYADGYRRALSQVGRALVRGIRVPVAGLVTMDMTMLDVTDVPCEIGDVATLLGPSDWRPGAPRIDLMLAARESGVAPYELLTGLHARLPRVYVRTSGV